MLALKQARVAQPVTVTPAQDVTVPLVSVFVP